MRRDQGGRMDCRSGEGESAGDIGKARALAVEV